MQGIQRPRHLEVMIGESDGALFAELVEFFRERGFTLSESQAGTIYRLWVDRPNGKPVRRVHRIAP